MNQRKPRFVCFFALTLGIFSSPWLFAQWNNPPSKKFLENGLTVIMQQDDSSAITVMEIFIKGGRRAEPAGKEGLSYLTTRLSLEIPDQGKAIALMEKSSRYMMASKGDFSLIHIECLTDFLADTLEVFSAILKDPLFSGIRFDRVVEDMNDQRKIENDDNINIGHLTHLRTFLGNLGYAGSAFGEETALKKIKVRDVEGFYKSYFSAGNMILAVVSDLDGGKLIEMLNKYFGSLSPGKPQERISMGAQKDFPELPKETVIEKDTKQNLVSLGFALPRISRKNYALNTLLDILLGKGPGSRLWPLRSEEKLAYNVNSRTTFMIEGGFLEVFLETDSPKRDTAKEALKKVIARLHEQGVTSDELQEAKTMVKANFLRTNETKEKRVETLGSFEALGLGIDYFKGYFAEIDAVTVDAINDYIKDVLDPQKAALIVVGPKK
jgi:predicted Zn-dependent peptidase